MFIGCYVLYVLMREEDILNEYWTKHVAVKAAEGTEGVLPVEDGEGDGVNPLEKAFLKAIGKPQKELVPVDLGAELAKLNLAALFPSEAWFYSYLW